MALGQKDCRLPHSSLANNQQTRPNIATSKQRMNSLKCGEIHMFNAICTMQIMHMS